MPFHSNAAGYFIHRKAQISISYFVDLTVGRPSLAIFLEIFPALSGTKAASTPFAHDSAHAASFRVTATGFQQPEFKVSPSYYSHNAMLRPVCNYD